VLASNNLFLFHCERIRSARASISIPIPTASRGSASQEARVLADDAKHRCRAEELNRKAEVTTNLLGLRRRTGGSA
jgi:hypothetical protein